MNKYSTNEKNSNDNNDNKYSQKDDADVTNIML